MNYAVLKIWLSLLLTFALWLLCQKVFSQETDSTKHAKYFGGGVTVTNNGISLLPTFTLGKPAAIFDMKVGGRLTFEPQFRVSLEGKPWSFIFWWRYKIVDTNKFRMRVGAHPAVLFRTTTITNNGVTTEVIETQRYVAADLAPDYLITKNISVGLYYLHGYGLQDNGIRNSDFITINSNFSHIKLVTEYFLRFSPQLYYLKMDNEDGVYFTATMTLARNHFPLSLQSIINQPISTDITGGKDFLWNVSLVYAFGKDYVEK